MSNPKISVITVVWNDKVGLERTIQSVINQTYENIEFIIIDGDSSDGTVDVIKAYEDKIDYWVSEKDAGIYDAMNKGIRTATGTWVNFMNAGDLFANKNLLASIPFLDYKNNVLLYGKNINNGIERIPSDPSCMKYGGTFANHQSMFFNRSLIPKNEFFYDITYKIYADYELVNRLYLQTPMLFEYLDLTIAIYEGGGISSKVSTQKRKDKYRALLQYYGIYGLLRGIFHRFLISFKNV